MDFLKSKKDINIGKYSQESLDAVKSGDLKTIYQTAVDNNDYELLLDDDSIFNLVKMEINFVMHLFNHNQLTFLFKIFC